MSLEEYILRHIDAEGDYLHALWRDTQLRLSYGQMASGHLQGRVLKMLIQMAKPLRVLELGTFSGYATLCMAEGLGPDAEIHTFEVFDENEDFLRKWFEGSAYKDKIHLHIGDALQLVPQMQEQWDFAFIDADKREYVAYYETATCRRAACRPSMKWWRKTLAWRRSYYPCATASASSGRSLKSAVMT